MLLIAGKILSARYLLQAMRALAQTAERPLHAPFGRRIKKSDFFTRADRFDTNQFFLVDIEKGVGITAVVYAGQIRRQQGDVFPFPDLDGQIAGHGMKAGPMKRTDGIAGLKNCF